MATKKLILLLILLFFVPIAYAEPTFVFSNGGKISFGSFPDANTMIFDGNALQFTGLYTPSGRYDVVLDVGSTTDVSVVEFFENERLVLLFNSNGWFRVTSSLPGKVLFNGTGRLFGDGWTWSNGKLNITAPQGTNVTAIYTYQVTFRLRNMNGTEVGGLISLDGEEFNPPPYTITGQGFSQKNVTKSYVLKRFGTKVGEGTASFSGNSTVYLTTNTWLLNFTLTDLSNNLVTRPYIVRWTAQNGSTTDFNVSIPTAFLEIANGTHNVKLFYQGWLVKEYLINANVGNPSRLTPAIDAYTLNVTVYNIRTGEPIGSASLTLKRLEDGNVFNGKYGFPQTITTDSNGRYVFTQLYKANFSVTAVFLQSSNSTSVNLDEDKHVLIAILPIGGGGGVGGGPGGGGVVTTATTTTEQTFTRYGVLSVIVKDPANNPFQNGRVVLESGSLRFEKPLSQGAVVFPGIPQGTYTLSVYDLQGNLVAVKQVTVSDASSVEVRAGEIGEGISGLVRRFILNNSIFIILTLLGILAVSVYITREKEVEV